MKEKRLVIVFTGEESETWREITNLAKREKRSKKQIIRRAVEYYRVGKAKASDSISEEEREWLLSGGKR